jgi:hypothetical protein
MTVYVVNAVRILFWGFILCGSVWVVLDMVRRGRIEDRYDKFSFLPEAIRPWVLGESKSK